MLTTHPEAAIDTILETVPLMLSKVSDEAQLLAILQRYKARAYELNGCCDYPSEKIRKCFAKAFSRIRGKKGAHMVTLEDYL